MTTPTIGSLEKRLERLERIQSDSNARHEEVESRLGILDDGDEGEPEPYRDYSPGCVGAAYALYGDSDKIEDADRSDTPFEDELVCISIKGGVEVYRDHNERYQLTTPNIRGGSSDSVIVHDPGTLRDLADAIEKDRASREAGMSRKELRERMLGKGEER